MKFASVLVFACCTGLLVVACDKKDDASQAAPAASSAGAAAAPAAGDSVLSAVKYGKPAGRGSAAITQKAVKGGQGGTVPSVASQKMSEASTDRQVRKHAKADMADCTKLPDNAAECSGNELYFCDDQKLWVVDCDAEGKLGGATAGSCFEGEQFVDCLGEQTATDGTDVWCDFRSTVCCGADGGCWTPAK